MNFNSTTNAQAVPQTDSLDRWLAKFSEIRLEEMSSDGKWVAMKKTSNAKSDTMMIFSTIKPSLPLRLRETSKVSFLKDNRILSFGNNSAILRDVKKGTIQSYKQIRQYDILKKRGEFLLHDAADRVSLYESKGTMLRQIEKIKRYITDHHEWVYAEQDDKNSNSIYKINGNAINKVYATNHIIERLELSGYTSYLVIYEKEKLSDLRRLVVIDTKTDSLYYPLGQAFTKQDFSTFREIRNEQSALIKVVSYQKMGGDDVDMYYGNEHDLKSMMTGRTAIEDYWLWNIKSGSSLKLDLGDKRSVCDLGNDLNFLHFNGDELRDYIYHRPFLNISLYNVESNDNFNIGIIKPELAASVNGRYLLYQLQDSSWELLDTSTKKKRYLMGNHLRNPVFTTDDSWIYFDSDNGLWQYEIYTDRLSFQKVTEGKSIRILNAEKNFLSTGYSIYQSTIKPETPLIIESKDEVADTVSYFSFSGNKIKQTFLTTKDQVKFFLYSDRLDRWCWLEENYNQPPVLKVSAKQTISKTIFDESCSDRFAKNIRQDVVSYKLSSGRELKGLLYYPQYYKPSKKYPMIVNIYQIQSGGRKEYLLPKYDGLGFNIRILLEKGYFVFLPDLITDGRGPGIAGLECINAALDVLSDHSNIDWSKIGLTGHSFGGYLTNFIATQTSRFTAYISGSGVSDIIQSYYSLNRNFPGAHYWQLETGQYQMASSFAENKQLYFNNNPIYNAEKLSAPILLWTGRADENVVPDNTMALYLALKRYRKDVIALFYKKSGHSLTDDHERLDLNNKVLDWWNYFLKNKKPIYWIDQ